MVKMLRSEGGHSNIQQLRAADARERAPLTQNVRHGEMQ